MQTFRDMSPAQLAEYVGPGCSLPVAAQLRTSMLQLDYEQPADIPDHLWELMVRQAVADTERINRRALIEALEWALAQIPDDLDPDHQEALAAARAALAQAKGE